MIHEALMVEIKLATTYDIEAIENILLDVYTWLESIGQPLWTLEQISWNGLLKNFDISDFRIAYQANIPVGCMVINEKVPSYWDKYDGSALFIHKLAVIRAASGKGVSTALIDYAKNECESRNLEYLRLDTHAQRLKVREMYKLNRFDLIEEKILFGIYPTAFYEWKRR